MAARTSSRIFVTTAQPETHLSAIRGPNILCVAPESLRLTGKPHLPSYGSHVPIAEQKSLVPMLIPCHAVRRGLPYERALVSSPQRCIQEMLHVRPARSRIVLS